MPAFRGKKILYYIDGKREIRDINMSFKANYESGEESPVRSTCGFVRG